MIRFTSIPSLSIGPLDISTHALMMALGIVIAYMFARQEAKRHHLSLDLMDGLVNWAAVGGIIGARLWYVLLNPGYYQNIIDIFKLWEGGLISFGGALGGFLGVYLYLRHKKVDWILYADLLAPYTLLGWGIGRIGDFLAWEEIGTITTLPWGVDAGFGVARHPVQLYTLMTLTIGFLISQRLKKTKRAAMPGFVFMLAGVYYFTERFFMEFFRDDVYGAAELVSYRYFAQATSIVFIILLIVWFQFQKRKIAYDKNTK